MTTVAELMSDSGLRARSSYRLDPLSEIDAARWDELTAPYEGRELFHSQVWLNYVAASRGVTIQHWAIRNRGNTVGYLCGGLGRIGPFRILGSPLQSWSTNVMGPLFDDDVDQPALLSAFDALARRERLAMIELEHPMLSEAVLRAGGFTAVRRATYIVMLTPADTDPMWRALDSTCRNRIRKALRLGLTVEDTDDPAVMDEYYDLYLRLMRRKRFASPFGRRHVHLLFSHLKPADRLFALRVKDARGRVLSVGLFPHDDRSMYFWSGASRADAQDLCPNDLLHWRAMCLGAERGLRRYNMSGDGRFKRKFGGELVGVARWHKCYSAAARLGRTGYELWFRKRSRIFGGWRSGDGGPTRGVVSGPHAWAGPWPRPSTRSRIVRLSDICQAPLHDFPVRDWIIDQYLPLTSEMRVLEVGPGSGITAFRLAPAVRHLSLLDAAKKSIERLQHVLRPVPNINFVCADVCAPDLTHIIADRFDAIYSLAVFEFLLDPQACLRNLAALLNPGGRLLIQFPNYAPPRSDGPTHYRRRADLEDALRQASFSEWAIYSLRLRPFAAALFKHLHERPIRLYRRWRDRGHVARPLIYDDTWTFHHGGRLEPFKYALNTAWLALGAGMRLGGDVFEHAVQDRDDIFNRNLLVLARR